jgi:glycerol kinase
LEGIISYSAATIQWLRDQLQMIDSSEETQELAESVENNAGVYLVPAFAGLSAPYWSTDARAAIVGMTAHATRAHVVRAALESIAYQVRDVLGMMSEQTGVATRLIHADGGATANGFLMQFTADIINAEVRTSTVAESSPLGAVMCGAIGSEVASIGQLNSPGRAERYQRKMSPETADACYAGWKQAVKRVLL